MKRFYLILFYALYVAIVPNSARAIDECQGATYYSAEYELCLDCPPGFDANSDSGKTDISQCQIKCPGGYYPAPSDEYVALEYMYFDNISDWRNQVFGPAVKLTGDDTLRAVFYPFKSDTMGIVGLFVDFDNGPNFQIYSGRFRYGDQLVETSVSINQMHDVSLGAGGLVIDGTKVKDVNYANFVQSRNFNIGGVGMWNSHYYGKIYGVYIYRDNKLTHRYTPVRRISDSSIGFYDDVTNAFVENTGLMPATGGAESPFYKCMPVGQGFWTGPSITNYGAPGIRHACPSGLTTIGYGLGADEAGDCGPTLHLGDDYKLYLRSDRKTTPALCVQQGTQIFYGNAVHGNLPLHMHIQQAGTIYSIFSEGEQLE